jgi:hypothetical protein
LPLVVTNGFALDDRDAAVRSKVNWYIEFKSCMSRLADSSVVLCTLPGRWAAIQGDFFDVASESREQVVPIQMLARPPFLVKGYETDT